MSLRQLGREINATRGRDTGSRSSTSREPSLYRMRIYNYQTEWLSISMPFLLTLPILSIAVHRRLARSSCVLAMACAFVLCMTLVILSRSTFIAGEWMTSAIWLPHVAMMIVGGGAFMVSRPSRSVR